MKTELKEKGYAIVTPNGRILNWTFHKELKHSIETMRMYLSNWITAKKDGYIVKKAELTIKIDEK